MSVVVGIDPSLTCTGVAVIRDGQFFTTRRIIAPNMGASLDARRARIRRALAGILAEVPAQVDVTVIEVPHSRQQFGAQNERIALYWMLVDQLLARGPVVEASPAGRAKLATGKGNAKKADVVAQMRDTYPAVPIVDDNVADAVALAAAGARWAGTPTQLYTPGQEAAYKRLAWPIRHAQKAGIPS